MRWLRSVTTSRTVGVAGLFPDDGLFGLDRVRDGLPNNPDAIVDAPHGVA